MPLHAIRDLHDTQIGGAPVGLFSQLLNDRDEFRVRTVIAESMAVMKGRAVEFETQDVVRCFA